MSGCQVIGWDCEGVSLSRDGRLTLMQFSSEQGDIFLLDMISPIKDHLVKVIKPILESERIKKVIHDPAMDSDAAFHQFGITVKNVHCTQQFHCVISSKRMLPNLGKVLEANNIAKLEKDNSVYVLNPGFWETRPMTHEMMVRASEDVKHLIPLYLVQIRQIRSRGKSAKLAETNSQKRLQIRQFLCETFRSEEKLTFQARQSCERMHKVHIYAANDNRSVRVYGRSEEAIHASALHLNLHK